MKILHLTVHLWSVKKNKNPTTLTLTGFYLILWTQPTIQQRAFQPDSAMKMISSLTWKGAIKAALMKNVDHTLNPCHIFTPWTFCVYPPLLSVSTPPFPSEEWLLCRCDSVGSLRQPLNAAELTNSCRGSQTHSGNETGGCHTGLSCHMY